MKIQCKVWKETKKKWLQDWKRIWAVHSSVVLKRGIQYIQIVYIYIFIDRKVTLLTERLLSVNIVIEVVAVGFFYHQLD